MKGRPMTLVTAQMSVSLDGYYAGPRQGDADTSDLQSWLNGPEAAGFFRVTRWAVDAEAWRQRLGFSGGEKNVNSDIIAETFDSVGARRPRERRASQASGMSASRWSQRGGTRPAPRTRV